MFQPSGMILGVLSKNEIMNKTTLAEEKKYHNIMVHGIIIFMVL